MKCNKCWIELEPKTKSVASLCGHLFCLTCAEDLLGSADGESCPLCDAVISKSTVKIINVLQDARLCQLNLCGQEPDTALKSALASVKFYLQQKDLDTSLLQSKLEGKIERVQEACKRKLQEVHEGYLTAKRKYQELLEVKRNLEADTEELKSKYQSKAQQTKKHIEMSKELQGVCEQLQWENKQLKRGRGSNFTPHGPVQGMHASNFQGQGGITPHMNPGQMVAVHHKQMLMHPGSKGSDSTGIGSANRIAPQSRAIQGHKYATTVPQRMLERGAGTNNLNLGEGEIPEIQGRSMNARSMRSPMKTRMGYPDSVPLSNNHNFLSSFPRSPHGFL